MVASKPKLTQEQNEKITKFLEQFNDQLRKELSDKGWQRERKERVALFQRVLAKGNLASLSKSDIENIIKSLWATRFWTNKDYLVKKVLNNNGLPKLKQGFRELLYGEVANGD